MKPIEQIAIPAAFRQRLQLQFPKRSEALLSALDSAPATAVHLNPKKPAPVFPQAPEVPWNTHGRYVSGKDSFALDPLWHIGAYYVMEPASQVVGLLTEQLLRTTRVSLALDLCAAPGGKSTVLRSVLPDDAVLVSNDVHRKRAEILLENITKWGHASHIVTSAEPGTLADSGLEFDLILVDAPCSGEGMFRKDHNARSEWSPENVASCALRQHSILDEADRMLRPGGALIYSTCTFAEEENDRQLSRLEERGWQVISLDLPEGCEAFRTKTGWQFAPGITRTEGLFVAALQKPEIASERASSHPALLRGNPFTDDEQLPFGLPDKVPVYQFGNHVRYLPDLLQPTLAQLQQARVAVLKAGVALYSAKSKHWVPAHEWAMAASPELPVSTVEFNREQALNYLRGQAGREDLGKGWKLAVYQHLPLGWLKAVGNRWNNHYPLHWKLRS